VPDDLQGTEIAIVGISGRFPGAQSTDAFWHNLVAGRESISFLTDDELISAGVPAEVIAAPNYVRARGILQDAECFDASFFGFTPKTAELTDPQNRLFLECAWEVLESAGYDPLRYRGSIGVYAGKSMSSYLSENLFTRPDVLSSVGGLEVLVAGDKDHLTTGVSYKLNLKGPSITVQTACSTSLVAVHLACQSLLHRECDMALAGGVSVVFPQAGYIYQEGGIRSPDGHCRAFDASASGTVGGSGVGIVLLKRLEEAIEDGDSILAIIRGSAANNDGSLKVGYTAPSVDGQSQVIAEAQAMAGVGAETIGYVEAHGTGTNLGDPIEISALTRAFRATTDNKRFCALGSLKTNIGHLDAAAGVAGLIKTVLALQHKSIPPSLHFKEPNPKIDFDVSPFFVNNRLAEWPSGPTPRRAGVSSFGMGGTNAHVVLEEAPPPAPSGRSRTHKILVLSAKSSTALDAAASNLAAHLRSHPDLELADAAYTLQVGRQPFRYRRMVVCQDRLEAAAALDDRARVVNGHHEGADRRVAFMFTGQGAQRPGLGRELYRTERTFREHVDECAGAFEARIGFDIRSVMFPGPPDSDRAAERLSQTHITQPALFAFEYALAKLWMSWGIHPDAMIGHSIGEYVAACLANVFSVEDAIALVAERGRLMGQLPGGDMLSVPLAEAAVAELLNRDLSIAAINGPELCVVSGAPESVHALELVLANRGVASQQLHTSHAFHSSMMEPILEAFTERVKRVRLAPPAIPFVSNVTGNWITAEEATDSTYWARHLRHTVRFSGGLERLFDAPDRILLEIGPAPVLSSLARRHGAKPKALTVLSALPHPNDRTGDVDHTLRTLGQLWLEGCQPDWASFHADERRRRVRLPTYPFERQPYWIAPGRRTPPAESTIQHKPVADWFFEPSWQRVALNRQTRPNGSRWLLFVDEQGVGDAIAHSLMSNDCDVVCVSAGASFSQLDDRRFVVEPGRREHYDRLVSALKTSGGCPHQIVHLWSITSETPYRANLERFAERQQRGFYSLLYFTQALNDGQVSEPLQLTVGTNQAQHVNGQELLCPDKATVQGLAMTIGAEFPHIACRSVDLWLAGPQEVSIQAENLLTEAAVAASDRQVAYRGRYRWIPAFPPVSSPPISERPARLRAGGTYLITGGVGGMGLALAEYLAERVKAKLVLVGRSELPARERWQDYLSHHDEADPVALKIGKLRAIEQNGGEVLVCRADVSDERQMSEVLTTTRQRFGPVHGVIHAAGIPGGGVMLRQTPETVEKVFAAKVRGTVVLGELFKDEHLDFMVFCSSRLSFFGNAGRADYAAASRFMDLFAADLRKRRDGFVTVINWDTWLEVGMAVQSKVDHDGKRREVRPELGMTTPEGIEVFARILDGQLPQTAVSLYGLAPDVSHAQLGSPSHPGPTSREQPSHVSHPRPEIESEYEAPRTEEERALAVIWEEVSGIAPIGIRDNFFELGGDSVIALQIVAKANQTGLKLTPRLVLEHQTIAELAAVAGHAAKLESEQGIVAGPVPLTPVQRWYLERSPLEPHHFNQSVLLEELQPIDYSLFQRSLRHLLAHHDALRLRFAREGSEWRQSIAAPDDELLIDRIDLSSVARNDQPAAIEAAAAEVQRSLNLSKGPLLRVAYFDLGPEQHGRWLLVIHHLAVDVVSWRPLLEDLQAAYQALSGGGRVSLPPKTLSFKQWSEQLSQHARSAAVRAEFPYWSSVGGGAQGRLPIDFPEGENNFGSSEELSGSLTTDETRALIHRCRTAYGTQIDELLLTAITQAFSRWTGRATLLLDLEGHGREEFIDGIDVSRTVGWFTSIYPVALALDPDTTPHEAAKQIARQLRAVPHHGMNYGLLRYLTQDSAIAKQLNEAPQPEVGFLYLGTVDQRGIQSSFFRAANESAGPGQSPKNSRPHLLEVIVKVESEHLKASWMFSCGLHRRETIRTLNEYFLDSLRSLIRHADVPRTETAPARFPLAGLDGPALARLAESSDAIEDLYPLSPMQQGMLFHSLYHSESSVYCQRVGRWFHGDLNVSAFQQAWQSVVDRHAVLRTTFHWKDLDRPLQLVHQKVPLSWREQDWRGLGEAEQQRRLDGFIQGDQERGFDLTRPPLMRLSLMRLADDVHYFHWSFHHCLLDGWCINLVVKEVLDFYEAFSERRRPELKPPRPYRDYIAWLGRQELAQAEAFWRGALGGFIRPTTLGGGLATSISQSGRRFDHQESQFSESDSDALVAFAKRHKLTASTVFQGTWALLMSQRCRQPDIVFGSVVSGQSADIDEIGTMIGLFMNTLPMRAAVDPDADLLTWLAEFQSRHARLREYEYTPLVDVQRWSEMTPGTPLFDCIVSFRNQPVTASLQRSLGKLNIRSSAFSNPSHYPMTLEGRLERVLWFRLVYDCAHFQPATIEEIRGQFATYLSSVVQQAPSKPTVGAFLERAQQRFLDEQENRLDGLSENKLRAAARRRSR
jgi:non-ribosomal peptide synthase protein (TIGR01720 family)